MKENYNLELEENKFEIPVDLILTILLAFLSFGFLLAFISIYFWGPDVNDKWWIGPACITFTLLILFLITLFAVIRTKKKNFNILLEKIKFSKLTSLIGTDTKRAQSRIVLAGDKGIGKSWYMENELMDGEKEVIKKNFLKIDFTSYEINDVKSIERKLKTLSEYWRMLIKTLWVTIPTLTIVFFQITGAGTAAIYNVVILSVILLFFLLTLSHLLNTWSFSMKNVIIFENLNRIHYSQGETLNSDEVIQMIPKVKKLKNKILIFEVEKLLEFGGDNVQLDPKYTTHYMKFPTDPGVFSIKLKEIFAKENIFDPEDKQLESFLRVLVIKYEFNLRSIISIINWHNHIYTKNIKLFNGIGLSLIDFIFIIEILKFINENVNVWVGDYNKHFKGIEIVSTEGYIKNWYKDPKEIENTKHSIELSKNTMNLSKVKFITNVKYDEGKEKFSIKPNLFNYELSNKDITMDLHMIKMFAALSNDVIRPFEPNQESVIYGTATYEAFVIKTYHFKKEDFLLYFEALFKEGNKDLTLKVLEIFERVKNKNDENYFDKEVVEFVEKNKPN